MLRLRNGVVIEAELSGGTLLELGEFKLTAPAAVTGEIVQARGGLKDGDKLIKVGSPSSAGEQQPGAAIRVRHADGAFSLLRLAGVESKDTETFLRLAEPPDFSVEGEKTRFHYYPIRTINGKPRFSIPGGVSWTKP